MADASSVREDDSITSANPSPSKKALPVDDTDTVSLLGTETVDTTSSRLEDLENKMGTFKNMMEAYFQHQNFVYRPNTLNEELATAISDNNPGQNRESAQVVPETPEASQASGGGP